MYISRVNQNRNIGTCCNGHYKVCTIGGFKTQLLSGIMPVRECHSISTLLGNKQQQPTQKMARKKNAKLPFNIIQTYNLSSSEATQRLFVTMCILYYMSKATQEIST